MRLPRAIENVFWEVDGADIDFSRHKFYVTERILEHGDEAAVRWLFRNVPKSVIISVLRHSRELSPKTSNFWRIKLSARS